ncbi:MAG: hypothetical protein JXX28_07030 [Deltaproteobacteria bacterium]|nr:hypothetical protein [Deltaproteobacteria bacterium]
MSAYSKRSTASGGPEKSLEQEAPAQQQRRDPSLELQSLIGNDQLTGMLAPEKQSPDREEGLLGGLQADRLARLGDRELRAGEALDGWSAKRERNEADWMADVQYTPEQLPTAPESILAARDPDWGLFVQACSNVGEGQRQKALQAVRGQNRWEEMLDHLGPEHMSHITGWLAEDVGDKSQMSVEERIEAASNSGRGQAALAAVSGLQGKDPEGRLTDRVVELLSLGVALPANERDPLGAEGILSVNSAVRAAEALLAMPLQEYFRVAMLLELTGSGARLTESFLLLEATAARKIEVADGGDLEVLEDFSDSLRGDSAQQLVDETSVVQTARGDRTALTSKFRGGAGAAAAQVVAAEADPVKALAMNQEQGLGRDALSTETAREQQDAIESHDKREARARNWQESYDKIVRWYKSAGVSGDAEVALFAYMNGKPDYDEKALQVALQKLARGMGRSYPGDLALESVRDAHASPAASGLTAEEIAEEANETQEMGALTGEELEVERDEALVEMVDTARDTVEDVDDKGFTDADIASFSPRVRKILADHAVEVDGGRDLIVELELEGGGKDVVTFTNVDLENGQWLAHSSTSGKSAWLDEANIVEGVWSELGYQRAILTTVVS